MSNNAIINPLAPPPKKDNSHVRGWAIHWAETTNSTIVHKRESIERFDNLYFEHGVNFGGTLNLFGGLNDDITLSIIQFVEEFDASRHKLFSCDIDMPDYVSMLKPRLANKTTSVHASEALFDKLHSILSTAQTINQSDLVALGGICIGDSHTASYTNKGYAGLRHNGATLHGSLKNEGLIDQALLKCKDFSDITLCFGSIDVRHHIMRQSDPYASLENLIKRLKAKVDSISQNFNKVEVIVPVPVEHEGRKLPKTGYYKGTPFFGSRDDRLAITLKWKQLLLDNFDSDVIVSPPDNWYSMDPEQFANNHMENQSSVHLSPKCYRRFNWGKSNLF